MENYQNYQINSPLFNIEEQQKQEKLVQVVLNNQLCSPEQVVNVISSIDGPVDVYCWYQGLNRDTIKECSAIFYRDEIFKPLLQKKEDVKLCPYSLVGWNFRKNVSELSGTTPIGESINKINKVFVECVYASSFFRYCMEPQDQGLQDLFDELKNKTWLFEISMDKPMNGKTVEEFFGSKDSIFRSINGVDMAQAYSMMQYVEGYYIVRESVEKGLSENKKKINIAIVLQNDEYKYYKDFSKDIEKWLKEDFGTKIEDVKITITFQFFEKGELKDRLYLDPNSKEIGSKKVGSYFDFLSNK